MAYDPLKRQRRLLQEAIDRPDQYTSVAPHNTIPHLGSALYAVALDIFEQCGSVDDFCIQYGVDHHASECIIFGGTNRLIFNSYGWHASKRHCRDKFLERFTAAGFGDVQ
jgi:hypothetical protein